MVLFFWADIQGAFCSVSIALYHCGDYVIDAAVTDGFFAIALFSSVIVVVVNTSIFSFVSITRSEMEFCFLFFVKKGDVTSLNNSMFSLNLFLVVVLSVLGFDVWILSWRYLMAVSGGGRREDS